MDEEEISEAMYRKCLKDDQEKFWSLITDSEWCFYYCKNIKNRVKVRKLITDPDWVHRYQKY